MSPVYLNPQPSSPIPFIDLKGDNNQQQSTFQVFGYLHGDHFSTSTNNSSFSYNPDNLLKSEEMFSLDYTRHDQMKVGNLVLSQEKASDIGQPRSSWLQSRGGDDSGSNNPYAYSINVEEKQRNQSVNSRKWKSSKVRIMQKMMVNSRESIKQEVDDDLPKRQTNDGIRVCTDCHTTTTPLWRSGPNGPKSLCNACGIRQRKARRAAMAAAAAAATATAFGNEAMSHVHGPNPKLQVIKSEKGLDHDKNHTLPLKKRSKIIDAARNANDNNNNTNYYYTHNSHNNSKKLGVEDFALSSNKDYLKDNSMRSFPRDEEEGAFLLMALSCGLACSSY